MGQQITIFGKTYANMEQAIDAMKISVKVPDDDFKLYDIELLLSIADLRGTFLRFIGLDTQARYAVMWSHDLQTTRQMLAFYRPDLLDLYDKANPHGEYHPYSLYGQPAMQTSMEDLPLRYVRKNIGKMNLLHKRSSGMLDMNVLRMCYDKLGKIKNTYVYELKESIYLLLDTRSCEKYLIGADWNIAQNVSDETIIAMWPEVTEEDLKRFAYKRKPKYLVGLPPTRENIFVFDKNTGCMYSPKEWYINGDNSKLRIGSWATMQNLALDP